MPIADFTSLAKPPTKQKFPAKGVRQTASPQTPIRIKPELKERLKEAAEADGYRSLATWMRHLATQRADHLLPPMEDK